MACAFIAATERASAASIDCDKAASAQDKLICANPDLSEADEKLTQAYARAQAEISSDARKALQESQRSWLEFSKVICPLIGAGAMEATEAAQCLIEEYSRRIDALDHIATSSGPFRVIHMTRFDAEWVTPRHASGSDATNDTGDNSTSGSDDQPVLATKVASYPRFDASTPPLARINELVAARALEISRSAEGGSSLELSFDIVYASATLISLSVRRSVLAPNAAHPTDTVETLNLLPATGRVMTATDLFDAKSSWKTFLTRQGFSYYNALADALRDAPFNTVAPLGSPAEIAGPATDPTHWALSPAGLRFVFLVPPEGTETAKTATIPWAVLAPYLVAKPPFPIPPR